MQDPDAGRNRSLDPGTLSVLLREGRLRLALASRLQRLVFLAGSQRQKAPAAPSTLWLQGTGSTVCRRKANLEGSPPLPVIRKPAPALVPGWTSCDLPIPVEEEVPHGEAFAGLGLPLVILGSWAEECHAFIPAGDKLIEDYWETKWQEDF